MISLCLKINKQMHILISILITLEDIISSIETILHFMEFSWYIKLDYQIY